MKFERIAQLPPYVLAAVDDEKDALRKKGVDVYDFGLGNPDGASPSIAVETLVADVRDAASHRYQPSRGIETLRKAIAGWYGRNYDVRIDPDAEAVCTLGSKEAIAHFLLAAIAPGDTAIVPDPRYPAHAVGVVLAGGTVVPYPVGPGRDPMADIARAYEAAPKKPTLVIVNFPHNPTTACVDRKFYEALVPWAKERGVAILSDLAYADLVFDRDRAPSLLQVPGAKEIAVETFTMSKSYNMPGWRVGFMVGNAPMVQSLARLKTYMDYGMFRPGQAAAAALLANDASPKFVAEVRRTYKERAEALVAGLGAAGWPVEMPKGTMFVWAPLPGKHRAMGSVEFARRILRETGVAFSPGVGFGPGGEGYVRFSLVEPVERTRAACGRVGEALRKI